jgi:hypothetical protein
MKRLPEGLKWLATEEEIIEILVVLESKGETYLWF